MMRLDFSRNPTQARIEPLGSILLIIKGRTRIYKIMIFNTQVLKIERFGILEISNEIERIKVMIYLTEHWS